MNNWIESRITPFIKEATFGVRQRLIVALVAVVTLGAALNYHVQKSIYSQIVENEISSLGDFVVKSSEGYMLGSGLAGIETHLDMLSQYSTITYIDLLDSNGELLGSSAAGDRSEPTAQTAASQIQRDGNGRVRRLSVPVDYGGSALGSIQVGINLAQIDRNMSKITGLSLAAPSIVLFFGLLLCIPIASGLTRCLDQLLRHTERAVEGDFDQIVELKTNDEFEKLAHSMNRMMGALRTGMRTVHSLAYRDSLTGLPNRAWFKMHLEGTVEYFNQQSQPVAILFLDVDRFKQVNDTLGHAAGDKLLRDFAKRITMAVGTVLDCEVQNIKPSSDPVASEPEEPAVCRLAGDEFVVVVPMASDHTNAERVAAGIVSMLENPFVLSDTTYIATTSIGVAIHTEHGSTPASLLRNADAAMYEAKSAGRNQYKFFDAKTTQIQNNQVELRNELIAALELDQFRVFFQPQFDIESGRLLGAEALIRWQHPNRGLLNPGDFLPEAEAAGLMPRIGREVVRKSLNHAKIWPMSPDRDPLILAVNSSFFELEDPAYVDFVLDELKRTGFNPTQLEIEISESVAMSNSTDIEGKLNRLRWAGVTFAVDDFGIGYSNLARLKKLDFEVLKIDKSLMDDIGKDRSAEVIVSTVLSMCQSLGLRAVAEGIENSVQLEFLNSEGCGAAQGYSLARPMDAQSFVEFSTTQHVSNLLGGADRLAG